MLSVATLSGRLHALRGNAGRPGVISTTALRLIEGLITRRGRSLGYGVDVKHLPLLAMEMFVGHIASM